MVRRYKSATIIPYPPTTCGCGLILHRHQQQKWGEKDICPIPPSGRQLKTGIIRQQWKPPPFLLKLIQPVLYNYSKDLLQSTATPWH